MASSCSRRRRWHVNAFVQHRAARPSIWYKAVSCGLTTITTLSTLTAMAGAVRPERPSLAARSANSDNVQAILWGLAATLVTYAAIRARSPSARALSRIQNRLRDLLVYGLTGLAVLMAGSRRPALRCEWRAHLAGDNGQDQVAWSKGRQALGFVAAAVKFRLADGAAPGVAADRCGARLAHSVQLVRGRPGHRDAVRHRAP